MMLVSLSSFSQSIGYEVRTNTKAYIHMNYKQMEFRHRLDNLENRISFRQPINLNKKVILSLPLHYKIEKHQPTLEPRLIYKFPKFKVWIQKEFWFNENDNMAIAIDIPYKNYQYRFGWDDSNTWRMRFLINL